MGGYSFSKVVLLPLLTVNFMLAKVTAGIDLLTSDRLCPDLVLNSNREERLYLMSSNLQIISVPVVGLMKGNNGDVPCRAVDVSNFGKAHGLVQVTVRAAQLSSTPWNFTGAGDCRTFIKFRTNEKQFGNETRLCRMYKIFNPEVIGFDNITNLTPAVWAIPKSRIGISGMVSSNSSEPHGDGSEKHKYLHVVYKSVYSASQCILTVQQYSVSNGSVVGRECDGSRMRHQLCGSYHCSEQRKILGKLGFLPYDGISDFDSFLGAYFSADGKSNFKRMEYDIMKNYDIEIREGELYFKPKSSYHAALFTGMTRGISFLFVLSVLISCISYQLKPYLRPSSSFDMDIVRERTHDSHRRCYRRPNSHSILPFSRGSNGDLPGGESRDVVISRSERARRELQRHGHHHRGVTGTHHNHNESIRHHLPHHHHHYHPHEAGSVIPEEFCQPPPPYETIQPPSYDETILRDHIRNEVDGSNPTNVTNDSNTTNTITNSNPNANPTTPSIQQLSPAETK